MQFTVHPLRETGFTILSSFLLSNLRWKKIVKTGQYLLRFLKAAIRNGIGVGVSDDHLDNNFLIEP